MITVPVVACLSRSSLTFRAALKPLALALLAAGLASPAAGGDTSWVGGSGDWSVAVNWSAGVPGPGDRALIGTGNANLGFDTSILGVVQSGGTISGTGNLTLTGPSTWSAGTVTGAGATTFNSTLAITGTATKHVTGNRVINVTGTTIWSGNTAANNNQIRFNGGTINNTGTWNDQNVFDSLLEHFNGTNAFNNAGTFNKQSDATTTVDIVYNNPGTTNVNAGTLRVRSAFTNSGTINVALDATFEGSHATFVNAGTLAGNGTVATHTAGDIVNRGTISPGNSVGRLTIGGTLTQTSDGILAFELESLASFDTLVVTGDVTLDGLIEVRNAGYSPVIGHSFKIVEFSGSRLSDSEFDGVTKIGYGAGVVFNIVYNANDVTLSVAAIPEPETWAMLLIGLGLVGWRARQLKV